MSWQAGLFGALVGNQLAATAVFVALYLRRSDWRGSSVARHLLYWAASAGALDGSWVAMLLLQWRWLVYVLLGAQAAVGLVGWQRVWLVWRATRVGSELEG